MKKIDDQAKRSRFAANKRKGFTKKTSYLFCRQWKWNSLRCVVSANVICEGGVRRCPRPDLKAASMIVGKFNIYLSLELKRNFCFKLTLSVLLEQLMSQRLSQGCKILPHSCPRGPVRKSRTVDCRAREPGSNPSYFESFSILGYEGKK